MHKEKKNFNEKCFFNGNFYTKITKFDKHAQMSCFKVIEMVINCVNLSTWIQIQK